MLLSAGGSPEGSTMLRLLLRVSPSETSCSFTPMGFIYSVYLYQGFIPLPVFLCPYGTRGGEVDVLLSAGGSPEGSTTLWLLLTCEPVGVEADTACRF